MITSPLRGALAASLTAASLIGAVTLATPAQAASSFQIVKVRFDSAGIDLPATNKKVNDEYVVIRNTDDAEHTIGGWRLKDKANHVYVFPAGMKLGAGKSVTVRTGKGEDKGWTRYQNRGYYVWNNDADTASLRDAKGKGGDTCSWDEDTPGSTKVC